MMQRNMREREKKLKLVIPAYEMFVRKLVISSQAEAIMWDKICIAYSDVMEEEEERICTKLNKGNLLN